MRWIRRLVVWLPGLGLAGLTLGVAGRWYYSDLLRGPDLTPTAPAISLKPVFPPPLGWRETAVTPVLAYADSLASSTVIVLLDGHVVVEFGETDRRHSVHSVRKSLVSALYGVAVERGLIDLDATLASLGIEESGRSLTEVEKGATIRDLLEARSGIYHPSIKADDADQYPAAGTHRPGEAFVYNNWDFNALGGIFERRTGLRLGDAFRQWIADPTGMQDFRAQDVVYTEGPESIFPAYRFWMSARDLARFGQLYLNEGRWGDRQIIPSSWIDESLTAHSDVGNGIGYGYLWWIMPDSSFMATGTGGQKVRIYPHRRLVLVNQVDTGTEGWRRAIWWAWGKRVNNADMTGLLRRLEGVLPELREGETGRSNPLATGS